MWMFLYLTLCLPFPASACVFPTSHPTSFLHSFLLLFFFFFWQNSDSPADGLLLVGVLCQLFGLQERVPGMWVQPWDGWAAAACPLDGGSGRESLAAQTAGPRSHVAGDGESRPMAHPRALILPRRKETGGEEHTHIPVLSLGESGVIFTILTEAEQISSRKKNKNPLARISGFHVQK